MATWDDLEKKYGNGQTSAPADSDPWAALEQKYTAPEAAAEPVRAKTVSELPKRGPSGLDRLKAGAAGLNRGFFADLVGLPVDTVANVLDLAKAGMGAGYMAITGKPASDSLLPYDRSQVPGTSEWIAKNARDVGMGAAIDNPAPGDALSRVVHGAGRAAGASVLPLRSLPISKGQQALNVGGGAVSGAAASTVAEVSDNPVYAAMAGMLPALASRGGAAAVRGAIRGGEAGAKNMRQRIQDFKNGGVEAPSAGLASGNGLVQGIENLLAQTPGSSGVFQRSKDAMISGMQERTGQIRDSISPLFGSLETGAAIQKDIGGRFADHFKDTQRKLYGEVDARMPGESKVAVGNTAGKLDQLTAGIEGAPNIGKRFINGRISDINDALKIDTGLTRPPGPHTSQFGGPWQPNPSPQLPYKAVSKLRSQVGKELENNSLVSDVPRSQWKQLYGSLSQDIGSAAAAAGPGATKAWERANTYTTRGITRLEDLQTLSDKATPEGAYDSLSRSLNAGPTSYERARNVVSPGTRQKFASTVIHDLGVATPGQQGAAGADWSPRTFLTNYNKMDPKGRAAVFTRLPGGKQHAENLADIAKTAEMIGQGSKVWANPSGTGAALSARTTLGGIAVSAFYSPMLAAGTSASLLGAHGASRLLTNPIFVNWLAKAPRTSPQKMQVYAQRLAINAEFTKDAQFQQDVSDYLDSVSGELEDTERN